MTSKEALTYIADKLGLSNYPQGNETDLEKDDYAFGCLLQIEKDLENKIKVNAIIKVFEEGCWVRRNQIEEPYFSDTSVFANDKQMIIGQDDRGVYFIAKGPVKCYVADKGKTWALTKEELENE